MKCEPNQSSSCPLSSIICSAPTPSDEQRDADVVDAYAAARDALLRYGGSSTRRSTSSNATMPTGRLMRKIQRQV